MAPQAGSRSPLLANVLLDSLIRRQGLKHRYAAVTGSASTNAAAS